MAQNFILQFTTNWCNHNHQICYLPYLKELLCLNLDNYDTWRFIILHFVINLLKWQKMTLSVAFCEAIPRKYFIEIIQMTITVFNFAGLKRYGRVADGNVLVQ